MLKSKNSQHYQFVYQAVPILFHHSAKEFIRLLDQDGMKFLQFWWEHVGDEIDEAGKRPMESMAYEFKEYKPGQRLVLLTLPPPKVAPEAFFMALIPPPPQRSFFPWKNLSNVYVLQYLGKKEGKITTRISAITPRAIIRDMAVSARPALESFYQAVLKLL